MSEKNAFKIYILRVRANHSSIWADADSSMKLDDILDTHAIYRKALGAENVGIVQRIETEVEVGE